MMHTGARDGYRSSGGLVATMTAFFTLYLLASCVALWSDWLEVGLLTDFQAGRDITEEQFFVNDVRQGLIVLGQFGIYLLLSVLFGVWIYRAKLNARRLGAANMEFTSARSASSTGRGSRRWRPRRGGRPSRLQLR
ncbi:MAG: hypothetical protein ACYTGG_01085 [Planctomycetota bacterium]|jgi:hypothetical protein